MPKLSNFSCIWIKAPYFKSCSYRGATHCTWWCAQIVETGGTLLMATCGKQSAALPWQNSFIGCKTCDCIKVCVAYDKNMRGLRVPKCSLSSWQINPRASSKFLQTIKQEAFRWIATWRGQTFLRNGSHLSCTYQLCEPMKQISYICYPGRVYSPSSPQWFPPGQLLLPSGSVHE